MNFSKVKNDHNLSHLNKSPSFNDALKFWIKLGFISFGGPAGQIAIMHEFLVDKVKWISEKRFLHALNYCMLLPGPEAQQLATYMGWLLHGIRGGIAAGLLFILPSTFILLLLSILYVKFGNIPWIYAIFYGLKPAVIAIVILALVKIAGRALKHYYHYIIALAAFVGLYFYNVPFPVIVLLSVLIGIIYAVTKASDIISEKSELTIENQSENDSKNSNSTVKPLTILTSVVIAWLIPFLLFGIFSNQFQFWKELILFFTKASLVTFGGAYAVLPYVAQVSVEQFAWLTKSQMVDGLALGETTPGPLIMVLGFVGFMAAYTSSGSSLIAGSVGLIVTVFYTFLPSFLFILAGAPLIERTRDNVKLSRVLEFVTAAIVGVILNLCIYLGIAVLFRNGIGSEFNITTAVWMFISLIALGKFKISIVKWIIASAVFGIVIYLIGFSKY